MIFKRCKRFVIQNKEGLYMVKAPSWSAGVWSRRIEDAQVHHYLVDRNTYIDYGYKIVNLNKEQIEADNLRMENEITALKTEYKELSETNPPDWLGKARKDHKLKVITNRINGLKEDLAND